ncbi:MAG: transposase [Anaerolineae bacterium]|nr:transposase [Anaerolineae bacterium]
MRKTFKYRLFPTAAQRTAMQGQLDRCRWVYNQTLEVRQTAWQERQESLSRYDTAPLLTGWRAGDLWLVEGHAQAQQDAQKRVDLAFRAFFRRLKAGETPGFPRFRGAGWYDSFTYPQQKGNWSWRNDGRLRLSKVGDVKIKLHRSLEGSQKTLTLRRDRVGNWYACFSCEVEATLLPVSGEMVGIDLGLKTFAMLSTGECIPRQRWMKRDAQDIARLQRKKEQFAKGSPERRKTLRALNHAYQRATHRRTDFAHQASRKLVNRFGLLVFEDLDIPAMQSSGNRVINRGIADVAWGQFVQFTTYKAESAGRAVLRVNPRGTTQACSGCGAVVPKDLRVRVHECPCCGLKCDRDLNAALNILGRGLASLDSGPRSSPLLRGEQSR